MGKIGRNSILPQLPTDTETPKSVEEDMSVGSLQHINPPPNKREPLTLLNDRARLELKVEKLTSDKDNLYNEAMKISGLEERILELKKN
ncbi:MAG: hypothetical protein LBO66_11740 [Deltaproteobacteria bacterium]|jgi:hypothetical protein|nr:hypothetical protein [Deltaproteobacteria bacterium]